MKYNPEEYQYLDNECVNYTKEKKKYILPALDQSFAIVEIILIDGITVESQYHPIRHGKFCGSKIYLGTCYGIIDLNPKFIWNGKEWWLNTFGTFLFGEIEINGPNREYEKN